MKTKLVALFAIAFMTACETPKGDSVQKKEGYSVKIIDSCEYIEVSGMLGSSSGYYSITHKGNCKNPIHNCK
jgi:hypothetical protein